MQITNYGQQQYDKIVTQATKNLPGHIQRQQKQPSVWKPQYKLQSFSIPQTIKSASFTKKFKLQIRYSTPQGFKSKVIFFGKGDQYVFNRDNMLRLKRLNSAKFKKNMDNLLSAQYWQIVLLQSGQNFADNVSRMVNKQLAYLWQQANTKSLIPKKDYTNIVNRRKLTLLQKKRIKELEEKQAQLQSLSKQMESMKRNQ